jgi:hypothetical protein
VGCLGGRKGAGAVNHNPFAWLALILGAATLTLVARGPFARWVRKVKRRRGGVYLWRVDHHRNRARRVNGYVGETVSYYFRSKQHLGVSYYGEQGTTRSKTALKVPSQPWSDLNPRMYKIIPLPWWLCWKWVLRPLETLVIMCTWPVYNDAKNHWNPRRIPKPLARIQRQGRDGGRSAGYITEVWAAHQVRRVVMLVGAVVIGGIAYGWMIWR